MARAKDERLSALLGALQAERGVAQQYMRAEMEVAQIEALKRYFGDKYGDEVEGRSQVTTREVFETIEWARPNLRRVFTSGDAVFSFEGTSAEGDQFAEQASDYINFLFLRDNPGETVLDDWLFDGLLQRVGIIAAEWKAAEFAPAQEATGLNTMQAQQLLAQAEQGRLRIEGQAVREEAPDEAHPDGRYFDFKIRRLTQDAKPDIFCVAPEDFRIAARAVSVDTAPYTGDIVRMMVGEAVAKWPDYREEIEAGGDTDDFDNDERRAERFRDLENWDSSISDGRNDGEAREIEIMREYIRYDLDGDGYPELIRTYSVGDCILEHDEVDEHIYTDWTPIRIPHRWAGLSIPDISADIQRTKTVLLRSALDCAYQNANPRVAYDQNANVQLDALLTVRPGVAIGVDGAPGDKLMPFQVPDLSQGALNMMQWMDRVAESRTGVTRQAQGFDPDVLHDTAKGVELMQNAGALREEEMARNAAEALQRFGAKLYRLVHKHQNTARAVKISGEWRSVDPRAWEADLRCTVSTGLGTGAREKQLMMMQMVQGDQVAWVANYGMQTPVVTPQHLYATVTEKLRIMGFKSPAKFFGEPVVQNPQTGQAEPFVPQPPPSPDQQKIQAQVQEGQARLQLDAQKAQMDASVKQYETQARAQADVQKAELDAQIALMKAQAEIELAAQKMQMEMALKERQMLFEMEMQERQFAFESQQAAKETEAKIDVMEKTADAKGKLNGAGGVSKTKFGGEPG